MFRPPTVSVVILAIIMSACTQRASSRSPAISNSHLHHTTPRYQDPTGTFSIAAPADVEVRHDFQRRYLDSRSWKAYADPNSHGRALLALVLPGSNKITAAELRIGVSTQPNEVAHCTDRPGAAVGASDGAIINGTIFANFHARDGAMSHYLDVQAYRVVHKKRCYAIYLWIAGTNPHVYDPPASPPFSRADAMRRLHSLLVTFHFND